MKTKRLFKNPLVNTQYNVNKLKNLKVGTCDHSKKEVVLFCDSEGELCCHNENPKDDAQDVATLKKLIS